MGRPLFSIHFVDTAWLEERLSDRELRIVDLRSAIDGAVGCIPGSIAISFEESLLDRADGSFVSGLELACVMSEAGIGDEHHVVAYDQGAPQAAFRFAQLLGRYGHNRVSVLDGGFLRWVQRRGVISHERARHPRASFTARMPTARVA